MHKKFDESEFIVSQNSALLDFDYIYSFLKNESYWGRHLTRSTLRASLCHSENFGLYHQGGSSSRQVGFARVITDGVLFGYLRDVFVEATFRGRGLGLYLCRSVIDCEKLRRVQHWLLGTKDAHRLYEKLGFEAIPDPRFYMQLQKKRTK